MDAISTTGAEVIRGICILIVIFNTIEVIHIFRSQKHWHNAHILFFNLALIDTALGCIGIVTYSVSPSQNFNRPFPRSITLTYLLHLNTCESIFMVLLLSIDRWIAVKWPLKYRALMTKKKLYIGIVLSWVLSILYTFLVVTQKYILKNIIWLYVNGILTVVQTLIMIYLYHSIFALYRRSSKTIVTFGDISGHSKPNTTQEVESQSEKNVTVKNLKGQKSVSESSTSGGESKDAAKITDQSSLVNSTGSTKRSEKDVHGIHQRHDLIKSTSYSGSQLSKVSSIVVSSDVRHVTNDESDKYEGISEKRNTTGATFSRIKQSKRAASGQKSCSQQQEKNQSGIDNNGQDRLSKGENVIQMSNKEKRLLKICFAMVVCFAYSYIPPVIVVPLARTGNVPVWLADFTAINILCGSLWNPILYFLNKFIGRRKTR